MSVYSGVLIGLGVLLLALGTYFVFLHYQRAPATDYRWVGPGEHPFKK